MLLVYNVYCVYIIITDIFAIQRGFLNVHTGIMYGGVSCNKNACMQHRLTYQFVLSRKTDLFRPWCERRVVST